MLEPWRQGIITKTEDITASTRRFWIQIPEVEKFDFSPGQFVTLDLPIHEQKNKRWRSYSIASAPNSTNIIELVIVLLEGGAGTNYLFNNAKVGTSFPLRGPQGKFTLPTTIEKDLYFICTGTGIAPFRSMVNYIHEHQLTHEKIHLIFGCRLFGDSLYEAELKALEKELTNFHHYPCFSREDNIPDGKYKGYVHNVYEDIVAKAKASQGDLPPAHFYLCGWKNMIDEAKQRIVALGYDKKDIHLELYG
jgi:CDP-4-dehydro-6-deoxyglucose reductase